MITYPRQGVLHGRFAEGVLLGTDVARPYISGAEWAAALVAEIKFRSLTSNRAWTAILRNDLGFPVTLIIRSDRYRWIVRSNRPVTQVLSENEWHDKYFTYFHTIVEQSAALLHGFAGLIIFSQYQPLSASAFFEELRAWIWLLRAIFRTNIAIFRPDDTGRRVTDLLDFLRVRDARVSEAIEAYTDSFEEDEVRLKRATKKVLRYLNPSVLTLINPILREYGYHLTYNDLHFGVIAGLSHMRSLQASRDRENVARGSSTRYPLNDEQTEESLPNDKPL